MSNYPMQDGVYLIDGKKMSIMPSIIKNGAGGYGEAMSVKEYFRRMGYKQWSGPLSVRTTL